MTHPWLVLVFGIIMGGFLGYMSSPILSQDVRGYVIIVAIVLMFILGRVSSPRRTRRMPPARVSLLNFLSGLVFGYGIVLLLVYAASG